MDGGGGERYTSFVATGNSPANTLYVPAVRKRWSRSIAVGGSSLLFAALVGWVALTGHDLKSGSHSMFQSELDEVDDRINKINEGMGGVYYNVFTGKGLNGNYRCLSGSYLKRNAEGHGTCSDCPVGKWCAGDVIHDCPDKTTSFIGSDSETDCFCKAGFVGDSPKNCQACPAGSFCPGGAVATSCPANSHSAGGVTCACNDGYYGFAASASQLVCRKCPANMYCAGNSLSNCTANSYSVPGSKAASECKCFPGYYQDEDECSPCEQGKYCKGKSSPPQACPGRSWSPEMSNDAGDCKCPVGYHGTDPATCAPCEPGYFCLGGDNRDAGAAAPGSYFPSGATKSTDSVRCPLGYMCPGGHRDKVACVVPGTYCTLGSIKPKYCPVGYYCAGNPTDGPMDKAECACDPGYYCNAGSPDHPGNNDPAGRPCPAGYYCTGGMSDKTACTSAPGFYCAGGSATPEGVTCPAGYYCVGASADKRPCTAAEGYFCPAGSANPTGIQCPAGSYCAGGSADRSTCDVVPGRYCPRGGSNPKGSLCPLGYYCAGGAADRAVCAAPPGNYCPEGTAAFDGSACPVGNYCLGGDKDKAACTAAAGKYCSKGSSTPIGDDCPQGYYCVGGAADKATCKAQPGSYCPATTADSYSPRGGVMCDEGVYCLGGQADQKACAAGSGRYCPRASGTASGIQCPVGFYCNGVVRRPCTAQPGNYCPAGSDSPDGVPCLRGYQCPGGSAGLMDCPAKPGFYCPEGSATPRECPAGYYCPGGSADSKPCQAYAGSHCPAGIPNVQGVKCPAGFFCRGGTALKAVCQASAGSYCPEGNVRPDGDAQCPENYYCPGGYQDPQACQASIGNFCPKGGSSPTGQPCPTGFYCSGGSSPRAGCNAAAGNYCPPGSKSSDGTPCPVGYFCAGGGNDKERCNAVAGKYCGEGSQFKTGSHCPAGYYCPGGAADKQRCSAARGNYCPSGTSTANGVQCPAGKYCAGGNADPADCPSPQCPTEGLWTMRLYSVPPGTSSVPLDVSRGRLIGENRVVDSISFDSPSDFKQLVPAAGPDWFGWIFYGQLAVVRAGTYNLCITSDDGSMLYITPRPLAADAAAGDAVGSYRLLIDDDGLHGPVQRCRALALAPGKYPVKITGFQAGGGVYMRATYSGSDTNGNMVALPSSDSTVPAAAGETDDGWTMEIYRQPPGATVTPSVFDRNDLVGESSLVPTVQEDSRAAFQAYVPDCPPENYAWRFYGVVSVYEGGKYTFCTNSDDGSLFFLDLAPPADSAGAFRAGGPAEGFTLVIDNDGLHGPRRYCKALSLTPGDYFAKVTGFQAGGGVYMRLTYSGPDTLGTELFVRSTTSGRPSWDKVKGGWSMDIFRVPGDTISTPLSFKNDDKVGDSSLVPVVSFGGGAEFRRYVAACPDSNFAWRLYGKLQVAEGGDYVICSTSDDGSLVYMDLSPGDDKADYALLVDNDGLHGARQDCKTIHLDSGLYNMKVLGFQAGGAVSMVLNYRGPDTDGQWRLIRSADNSRPTNDNLVGGWLLQIYRLPPGAQVTPMSFAASTLLGQSDVVPYILFNRGADFRVYVPQCPDEYFGWKVYGVVKVTLPGDYTFCITSDDGSIFYLDLTPSEKVTYTLLIDNDGLHGARQYCKNLKLGQGMYDTKIVGFQNGGGVNMQLAYRGPDTSNQWKYTRSVDSTKPTDDDGKLGWSMQIFSLAPGPQETPLAFPDNKLLGTAAGIGSIMFDRETDFRYFVAACPDDNFAWRLYGKLQIVAPGDYTFCTASDDGSLLYMDLTPGDDLRLTLVIDNDGLHGPRQYCRTRAMPAGLFQMKLTGFEAGGGVYMRFQYKGPDTADQWWPVRSVDSTRPGNEVESGLGWTMQIYRIPGGVGRTPDSYPANTLAGQANLVPTIDFNGGGDFRRYVSQCPDVNFAWRFWGAVEIAEPGDYTFCITSDDGSMLYMDMTPNDKTPSYSLMVANDGLHGGVQQCRKLALRTGVFSTKVTGFQGPGGVMMRFTYYGPDTNNQWLLVRSVDSAIPAGAAR